MAYQIVCAVYDVKAEAYGRPIFVTAPGLAIRAFLDEVKNPESQFGKYPGDFRLFQLGTFDDQTGDFVEQGSKLLLEGSAAAEM